MTYLFILLAGTPLTTQDWVMGSDWQVVCGVRGHHRCSHCPFEIKLSANVPCSSRGTGRLVFSKATCINISSNCTRLVVVTTSSLAGSNGGISVLKQPSAMLKGWGPNSPQGMGTLSLQICNTYFWTSCQRIFSGCSSLFFSSLRSIHLYFQNFNSQLYHYWMINILDSTQYM